ncbi:ShlB/FhaC/HecB family hemolysin secretion/activation protein [Rubrivivax sp. A210]|uniref:ShlB/FhaC/HecB family hemolysin secretion/activation protein n=1 Tax=Rubrivivax sp. A210 TaxID=2772301 RepID=UPI0019190C40|nr:ShlB/FhaC/HecB family hemolysin secretion/activation protein [Rubrivivax sp. A210]
MRPASSQVPTASELAPRQVLPPSTAELPTRKTPPRELGKPEGDLRLDVSAYRVDDDAPEAVRAALPRLTARFVGKQRSFEDLSNAAAEVTRHMQSELGYYLGYAYLPEQSPQDGVIRLAVMEGRLDRVILKWRNGLPVDREVVESYLARLVPGSVLKVRDVERVVFLVNDLRGITSRFEIQAGSLPGTSSLVVTPSPEKVVTGKAEFDANGSKPLGEYRLSGLVQVNSPFGRGDGFTANALSSTTNGLGFALLGYTTPVGNDGIKIGSSLSGVKYQLDRNLFPLDLHGTAYTGTVYGLYPVVRARNLNLFTIASFEQKQYEDRNLNGGTKRTVQTVSLGTTGDFRDDLLGGGVNTYEANVMTGEVKYAFGSTAGLDDDLKFSKFTAGFTRLQDLITGRALVYFALRGQYAANNLDNTEQFRLGGPDGVRAFAAGEGTGDIGAVSSLELRILPPEEWLGRMAREFVASVFVDVGYVQYRYRQRITNQPNAEANTATFTGAGFGLAWQRPGEYSLRLSLAKASSGKPRGGEEDKGARLFLQAAMLFN